MVASMPSLEGGEFIGLVAVAGGLLCGMLGILLGFFAEWQKTRREEFTAALKQDMLSRGMSADEIRTVLEAGSKESRKALGRRYSCGT